MNLAQLKDLHNRKKCSLIALLNGLPKTQRAEFVEQMQHVTQKTVQNCVDNGITLTDEFRKVSIPISALAGEKEQQAIIESVKRMAQMNVNCKYEIWSGCAHNISPLRAKQFNALIEKAMNSI